MYSVRVLRNGVHYFFLLRDAPSKELTALIDGRAIPVPISTRSATGCPLVEEEHILRFLKFMDSPAA